MNDSSGLLEDAVRQKASSRFGERFCKQFLARAPIDLARLLSPGQSSWETICAVEMALIRIAKVCLALMSPFLSVMCILFHRSTSWTTLTHFTLIALPTTLIRLKSWPSPGSTRKNLKSIGQTSNLQATLYRRATGLSCLWHMFLLRPTVVWLLQALCQSGSYA